MLVLVTRPMEEAGRTAAALARLGHAAVTAPATEVRRTGAALPAGRFDAVAATSPRAFATDDGAERSLPVYAVGMRTAEAARAAGYRDVRVGAGDAAGLGALLRLTLPRGARLLYLAGRDRKPALEAAIASAGHGVAVAEVYAAEPADRWPEAARGALRRMEVGAALHFSRRSAGLALALAARDGLDAPFLALRHLCLSADAAEPLTDARAPSVAVAGSPDEDALLALLSET